MNEPKQLSDQALHAQTRILVANEREILTQVLKHLDEIERRKLFSKLGYSSIYTYCQKELGYSEDAAYRRISAMYALRQIPSLEAKINSGSLTLSNIGVASQIIRAESKAEKRLPVERKLELFAAVEGKSKREAERAVFQMSTVPKETLRPEKIRIIDEHVELRLTANRSLQGKITRVKAALSHSNPDLSMAEIFEKLCEQFLEKVDRKRGLTPEAATVPATVAAAKPAKPTTAAQRLVPAQKTNTATQPGRKPIPAATRRAVFSKAGGKCRNCESTWRLEVDHIRPVALGGGNDIENLRILCRSCNQRSGIVKLGQDRMLKYTDRLSVR